MANDAATPPRESGVPGRVVREVAAPVAAPAILAVGAELKAAFAAASAGRVVLVELRESLTNPEGYRRYAASIEELEARLGMTPRVIACDLHPHYLSTRYAEARCGRPGGATLVRVQHHHAHVASLMAERGEPGPVVALACDGTGYGTDGAAWGCEVLRCERGEFQRLGHLEYFPLLGGDAAALETWRPAAALLHAAFGDDWRAALQRCAPHLAERFAELGDAQLHAVERLLRGGAHAPPTSSLGRVFDAAAFLLDLAGRNTREAEAPRAVEAAAADAGADSSDALPYALRDDPGMIEMSVRPTVAALLERLRIGEPVETVAARFHETIARMLADAAEAACRRAGVEAVGLTGGCFANGVLLRSTVRALERRGLRPLTHCKVPPGDGGVPLGQAFAAAWRNVNRAAIQAPPDDARKGGA